MHLTPFSLSIESSYWLTAILFILVIISAGHFAAARDGEVVNREYVHRGWLFAGGGCVVGIADCAVLVLL